MEAIPDLVAAGVTDVQVASWALDRDPARAAEMFDELVARFRDVAV